MNSTVAHKIGLSSGTYKSVEEFLNSRNFTSVGTFETTGGEVIVEMLNGATLRGILGIIFAVSIYTMLKTPGTGLPEFGALVSGVVLFGVPLLTGYATWFEISLVLLGIGLIALEIFVIPGFGAAGISGIILLLLGLVLTFVPAEIPSTPEFPTGVMPAYNGTYEALQRGCDDGAGGVRLHRWCFGFWLSKYLPQLPYFNRMVLQTTVGINAGKQRPHPLKPPKLHGQILAHVAPPPLTCVRAGWDDFMMI